MSFDTLGAFTDASPQAREIAAEEVSRRLGSDFARVQPAGACALEGVVHRPTGIVFRIIPGGRFLMGVDDREIAHVAALFEDRAAEARTHLSASTPPHAVDVAPFLCAASHVTADIAQRWIHSEAVVLDSDRAVVTARESMILATRLGVRLLSESEWEWLAREGGTASWLVDPPASIDFDLDPSEDVCARANAFAIRHLVSELGEWVADAWRETYRVPPARGALPGVVRGGHGGWQDPLEALSLHCATRQVADDERRGMRPAMDLPCAMVAPANG